MGGARHWSRRQLLVLGPASFAAVVSACQEQEFACDATTGLTPEGIAIRQNLAYLDRTKNPEQRCDNCQQYVPASSGQCGGCKVMPGPAHPLAYCKVWVQRT
jgi:hypothetical protein